MGVESKSYLRSAIATLSWVSASWQLLLAAAFVLVATIQSPVVGLTGDRLTSSSIFTLDPWAWIAPILGWLVRTRLVWRKKPTAISYSGYLNGVVALVFWSRLIVTAWNKRSQVKAKLKKHPVKKSKKK